MNRNLYIIAGCNGAGKTTASYTILPEMLGCREFVNAKNRVQARVAAGGHNIEDRVIERRYKSGIKNLFEIYIPLCDRVLIADNSKGTPKIFAKKDYNKELAIIDKSKFNLLKMNSL